MSYSFSARGATRADLVRNVTEEMQKVVNTQAAHVRDADSVVQCVHEFADVLPTNDDKDFYVSCSGSLGGKWEGGNLVSIASVSCSISVSLVDKQPEPKAA